MTPLMRMTNDLIFHAQAYAQSVSHGANEGSGTVKNESLGMSHCGRFYMTHSEDQNENKQTVTK